MLSCTSSKPSSIHLPCRLTHRPFRSSCIPACLCSCRATFRTCFTSSNSRLVTVKCRACGVLAADKSRDWCAEAGDDIAQEEAESEHSNIHFTNQHEQATSPFAELNGPLSDTPPMIFPVIKSHNSTYPISIGAIRRRLDSPDTSAYCCEVCFSVFRIPPP